MNANGHAKAARLYLEGLCERLDRGERLVRQRKEWWIGLVCIPLALGLSSAGCQKQAARGPNDPLQLRERCSTRSGSPDCEDPDCAQFCRGIEYGAPFIAHENDCHRKGRDATAGCTAPACTPPCSTSNNTAAAPTSDHEYNCVDGRDDDNDGDVDCSDSDCSALSVCRAPEKPNLVESPKERNCANGIDDDHDGATDCADPDCLALCRGAEYAVPSPPAPPAPVPLYGGPHMQ